MGGRGGASILTRSRQQPQPRIIRATQAQPQQAGPIQNQVPDDNNTPVTPDPLSQLQGMDDSQLAQLYRQSQRAQMPNHLDDVNDKTQKFIFTIGMNDRPTVVDSAGFTQFMQQNNIPQSQVLARSINSGKLTTTAGDKTSLSAQDVADMIKFSRLNYIGGKLGGQMYGAGTYFDMNGGSNTGYGGLTMRAVLNPATAHVITERQLRTQAAAFDRSHPLFRAATGGYNENYHNNNMSIYATVLGYNVIKDSTGSYHNIIDRKALVIEQ